MSLLISKSEVELPFQAEHIENYALPNNSLLVFSENWDYIMYDGLRGRTAYTGKFPENPEHSSINSIYSHWFTMLTQERMLYYSSTDNRLKVWDFQQAKVIDEWKAEIKVNPEFNFFMWLRYYENSKKATLLHMTEFGKAAIDDIFEDGKVVRRAEFELTNGNCMVEHQN